MLLSICTSDSTMAIAFRITFQAVMVLLLVFNYWNIRESCSASNFFEGATLRKDDVIIADDLKDIPIATIPKQQQQLKAVPQFGGTSWCPQAVCHSSPMCQPCKRRFLIIFTTGRSASTTLTWMLDSLPGVRMSGENHDILKKQYQLYQETFDEKDWERSVGKRTAFGRNEIPEGSLSCILHSTIELITPPVFPVKDVPKEESTIIGFKNIQSHIFEKPEEMETFVDFLKENLPCARFLVNYRSDIKALAKSFEKNFYWSGDIENRIREEIDSLKHLFELLGPEQAHLLDSAMWTKNVTVLNEALDWMGYSQSCHFSELLEFNTEEYKHTKTDFKDTSAMADCKRL